MNKISIFGLLVLSMFFLLGCQGVDISKISDADLARISEKAVVCEEPYIRFGTSCCLDEDNNNICDNDEVKSDATKLSTDTETSDVIDGGEINNPTTTEEDYSFEINWIENKGYGPKVGITGDVIKYSLSIGGVEESCKDKSCKGQLIVGDNSYNLAAKDIYLYVTNKLGLEDVLTKDNPAKAIAKININGKEYVSGSFYVVTDGDFLFMGETSSEALQKINAHYQNEEEFGLIDGMKIEIKSISKFSYLGAGMMGNVFNLELTSKTGQKINFVDICGEDIEDSTKCDLVFYINGGSKNNLYTLSSTEVEFGEEINPETKPETTFFYYCKEGECLENGYLESGDYVEVKILRTGTDIGGESSPTKLVGFFGQPATETTD